MRERVVRMPQRSSRGLVESGLGDVDVDVDVDAGVTFVRVLPRSKSFCSCVLSF